MKSLFSILLPLVGAFALIAILSGLQTTGEKMQQGKHPFVRRFGKALAATAMTVLGAVSIAGAIGIGYLLLQPSSLEPTACARFCD